MIQYSKWGYDLFLGWDTSTYVWWAELVQLRGPISMISTWHYPSFYVLALAGFGGLLGNISLAEKILPLAAACPLAYSFYRMTSEITTDRKLGYLAALIGGLTLANIRIFADLNRNLLALGLSLTIGTFVALRMSKGPLNRTKDRRTILGLWLPCLAVVAYTQIETYAVLAITLFLFFGTTKNMKTLLLGLSILAAPLIAALPIMLPFYMSYSGGTTSLPVAPLQSLLNDLWRFSGAYLLPLELLGIIHVVRLALKGDQVSKFLAIWLLVLLALSPIAIVTRLGLTRIVLDIPIAILAVTGLAPIIARIRPLLASASTGILSGRMLRLVSRPPVIAAALAILVILPTLATTVSNQDYFLRPYIASDEANALRVAAQTARGLGYLNPILVMYGQRAADFASLYSAYFRDALPESLVYYGKLQFLFTLPNPSDVYNWRYNPQYELLYSTQYRSEILSQVGSPQGITTRAIIVVTTGVYLEPLPETFLGKFEISPGIYIIPPNSMSPAQIDNWRLFAYSDRTSSSAQGRLSYLYGANSTWSLAPTILETVDAPPMTEFQANYTISLAKSWPFMQLTLHYWDWDPQFTFPDETTSALAPLKIYFDNSLVAYHDYAGTGPANITSTLPNVSSGIHTITISSDSSTLGISARLDYIDICPIRC